ncbi:hypothetical protein LV89_01157 [Arcicella aurantiaca]|uniref:Uncharacterized protein n=2 Tax=Arcicella aurantiaca TaxID=591202 RepID=A0A316EHU4_9BACT|nr:hypothetical protein LV89_01157 [Arcicella aurantiaca]
MMAFYKKHIQTKNSPQNIGKMKPILYSLLTILSLQSCDKVVDETPPVLPPTIPQATTEVFKLSYPNVSSFVFKPLEQDKTWQTDFVTPAGKVFSLVDYQGEIIDLNELVGTPKSLPIAIKQHFLNNYPSSQIVMFYDVMKSPTVTDGYKLVIQTDKNTNLNLYYDVNNNFVREEIQPNEKVSAIVFTSTDQINFDASIPTVIKQFLSNNQLKSASVIIYNLADKSYKIVLNFREKLNGALQTSEILLSDAGQILQWVSSIENEYSYKILPKTNLPTEINTYLATNLPNWQFDYGVSETIFGNNKTNFVTVKIGQNDSYLIVDEEIKKNDLILVRTQALAENYLPETVKTALTNSFNNWTFVKANVIYEPYRQSLSQIVTNVNHFQIEVKQGTDRYAVRLASDGNILYKYRIL